MTLRILSLGSAALALGLATPVLAAQAGGHGNHAVRGDHADHSGHAGYGQSGHGKAKVQKATKGGSPYAGKPCPPGLAKKNPGCVPPGQWKKGDRLPESWIGHYTAYAGLPDVFRSRYTNRTDRRYVYQNDKVYVVDAATRAVVDILTR
jgi:hypothetical protein